MDFTTSTESSKVADSQEGPRISTARSVALWEERIRDVQTKRATPELLAKIKADNEKQRTAVTYKKKAMRLERTNMLNCAQSTMALQTFSRAPLADATAAPTIYEETSARSTKYSNSINACLAKSKARRSAPAKTSMTLFGFSATEQCDSSDDDIDELEAEMRSDMDKLVSCSGEAADSATTAIRNVFNYASMNAQQQQQVTTNISSELHNLLQQLAHEPTSDSEIAAKFILFETFLANVVAIREETLAFWEEVKSQFNDVTRKAGERDIRSIDSNEAMGIVDDPHKWFVYSMTKKASDNSNVINKILASFRARLELLSTEIGECPYCLDQMEMETSTILGCCHRVCTDCWTHWVELKKDAAFCPLCRHEEFISEVLR